MSQPEPTVFSVSHPAIATKTVEHDEVIEAEVEPLEEIAMADLPMADISAPVESIPEAAVDPVEEAVAEVIEEEAVVATWPDQVATVDPGQPVPATPGTNTADAFIPNAAITSTGKPDGATADPYAAAAMTNGAGTELHEMPPKVKKTKGMSLFERVTGIGGTPTRTIPKLPENATPMGALVDSGGRGAPKIEPLIYSKPAAVPALEPELEQETLGGLDAADRIQKSHPEEDLLDIPAFLRRQAN